MKDLMTDFYEFLVPQIPFPLTHEYMNALSLLADPLLFECQNAALHQATMTFCLI